MNESKAVQEMYRDLKGMTCKAEIVTEKAIREELGDRAFNLLKKYHYIEHCMVDKRGNHWYAI